MLADDPRAHLLEEENGDDPRAPAIRAAVGDEERVLECDFGDAERRMREWKNLTGRWVAMP